MTIKTRAPAPSLVLDTLEGRRFDLAAVKPNVFTMIVFYRGVHCGYCRRYLQDLDPRMEAFRDYGVEVVVASCDNQARASQAQRDWNLKNVPIAYGLTLEKAQEWGLFISTGIKDDQPAFFSEPGLFLVQPDGILYAAYIQTLPFARPHLSDVLDAIKFVTEKGKPARGEVVFEETAKRRAAVR
jgi:peroxiredoxin